ncbi:hypothetical protein [Marinobacter oulmenensis]|uniref:RING-type E3 ubiquitin transferase n=1 Tax=Marinobacter oulmenensis TaxID=643747 RepID=A0A840UBW2_9GAMM|nr:hypothetical protein [Marinobacter oulmenensis]MBB5320191.1 hypothetical protein [Marinobacter oulmenensis]
MEHLIFSFARNVQQMDTWFFIAALCFSGIFAFVTGLFSRSSLRAYRIVADTPTSRIRSAPQGYVELKGQCLPLDPAEPVYGPFTGKPCLWYRAWVEEERGSGDDKDWVTIYAETDPRPFRLNDGTGECFVAPCWADMRMRTVTDSFIPGSWGSDMPEPLRHVDSGFFSRNVRFSEERFEEGEGYVIGHLTTTDGGEGSDEAQSVSGFLSNWRTDYMAEVEGRPDKHPPNPRTMGWVHGDTAHWIGRWLGSLEHFEAPFHVVGPSEESRRPFIVGKGNEEGIVKRLRWSWIGFSVGFVISATVFLSVLMARVGVLG